MALYVDWKRSARSSRNIADCGYGSLRSNLQESDLVLIGKKPNGWLTASQQGRDILSGAVADANPDDLRRCAPQHAETMKVFVFRDENAFVLARELPNAPITGPAGAERPNV